MHIGSSELGDSHGYVDWGVTLCFSEMRLLQLHSFSALFDHEDCLSIALFYFSVFSICEVYILVSQHKIRSKSLLHSVYIL